MQTAQAIRKIENHYPDKEYNPHNQNVLQKIFKQHFHDFTIHYEERFAEEYGKFRLDRIKPVVERFKFCGDYTQGVTRVKCSNPQCSNNLFIPFSCKGFNLCPSCSQKRTLIQAEYLTQDVLLNLPHRQFVFTFPKMLRYYFKTNWDLFPDMSNLILI